MFKIGNVKLENQLILAPMAGVNCPAFRVLCREYGAGLVYTQMFHVDSIPILQKEDRLDKMLGIKEEEKPVTIQLVGNKQESISESTRIIERYADIIDFNLGCPDKDILATRSGGFFSKHPKQINKVIKPILENTNKPVTAKIRLGWNNDDITVLEQCKVLEDLGVAAIAIHGRTVKQFYTGKADWDCIKKAKEKANIPIIGNGDIIKPGDAKSMLEKSKVDFLMIGRGCLGNPSIFERINHLLEKGENKTESTNEEKKKSFIRFTELYKKYEEQFKMSEFKTHAMWFTKSVSNARRTRNEIMTNDDLASVVELVENSFS